jgi:hypothetical protein
MIALPDPPRLSPLKAAGKQLNTCARRSAPLLQLRRRHVRAYTASAVAAVGARGGGGVSSRWRMSACSSCSAVVCATGAPPRLSHHLTSSDDGGLAARIITHNHCGLPRR